MINVIVWRDLAERQRKELLRSNLLTVYGTLERAGEVVHLIAGRLRDQSALLGKLTHAVLRFSLRLQNALPTTAAITYSSSPRKRGSSGVRTKTLDPRFRGNDGG